MNNERQSPDPSSAGESQSDETIRQHVKARSTWLRLFYMIVVAFLYGISRVVVGAVVLLQFFWVLLTGGTNRNLESLGQSLATYTYQVICYLTFITELKPFPFDAVWPSGPPDAG
ncbi:MAG: DUF4389 domain-containing protein [Gammaproteobacteria bacterium]